MVTTGGTGVMVLGVLAAIAVATLVPTRADVGIVRADSRSDSCSWDYGGPNGAAFEGLGFDQRTLNVLLFVPAGMFLVLAVGLPLTRPWRGRKPAH